MMWALITLPFFLQASAIAVDEWYFHYQRGLPKWERIGHPLDTFSMIVCLSIVSFSSFSPFTLKAYIGAALFSCFMVTKDEFVHKEHCPGAENWLHACLFILHPILLLALGLIWPITQNVPVPDWLSSWLSQPTLLKTFLQMQLGLVVLFCLYQIIFWNFVWKNKPVLKQ